MKQHEQKGNDGEREGKRLYEIREGTVIDHIPVYSALNILKVLGVDTANSGIIGVGMNFQSNRMHYKDVIKIENKSITQEELNRIALFAPHATINRIKDGKVAEKLRVTVPQQFTDIVKCTNPNCITNHQKCTSKFHTMQAEPVVLQCHYCEKTVSGENIRLL